MALEAPLARLSGAALSVYAEAVRWYRWLGINAALFLSTLIIFSYAAYVVSLALGQQHDPVEIALAPLGLRCSSDRCTQSASPCISRP
jgi:hypothetical protein